VIEDLFGCPLDGFAALFDILADALKVLQAPSSRVAASKIQMLLMMCSP